MQFKVSIQFFLIQQSKVCTDFFSNFREKFLVS